MLIRIICKICNGSGEGKYDGSRCQCCRGDGELEVQGCDICEERIFVGKICVDCQNKILMCEACDE